VADQLWLMTRIREEVPAACRRNCGAVHCVASLYWIIAYGNHAWNGNLYLEQTALTLILSRSFCAVKQFFSVRSYAKSSVLN